MIRDPAPRSQTLSHAPGGAVLRLARQGGGLSARLDLPPPLPLARLLAGRSAAEAAALLPRLFALCRMAQETAAGLALDLPVPPVERLFAEILRDHLVLIFATLPRAAGLPPRALPQDAALALFGPARRLPETPEGLAALAPQHPVLSQLLGFAAAEAAAPALPPPTAENVFTGRALENSPAGRQAAHPLLLAIEAQKGRGPLWRFAGLLADAGAALAGHLPAPHLAGRIALVPSARGTYALRIATLDGRVTGIDRATPTDHALAPGGALRAAMARLPVAKSALAPLVLALHDPCIPVTLQEAQDA